MWRLRAKYRIAFIGNIDDWKNRRSLKDFIPELIDIIDYNKGSIEIFVSIKTG